MFVLETERLLIRELNSATDAEFICELLNSPKFIEFIGDRGVRSADDAAEFIEKRYRQGYRDHGYGLYLVELRSGTVPVGICGFVKRETLDAPDLGFAFLPEFEHQGYGLESAQAMLGHGREELGFDTVLAITSQNNDASGKLLEKLGFGFSGMTAMPDGDVKLYKISLLD